MICATSVWVLTLFVGSGAARVATVLDNACSQSACNTKGERFDKEWQDKGSKRGASVEWSCTEIVKAERK
jgi:hypothetical protein